MAVKRLRVPLHRLAAVRADPLAFLLRTDDPAMMRRVRDAAAGAGWRIDAVPVPGPNRPLVTGIRRRVATVAVEFRIVRPDAPDGPAVASACPTCENPCTAGRGPHEVRRGPVRLIYRGDAAPCTVCGHPGGGHLGTLAEVIDQTLGLPPGAPPANRIRLTLEAGPDTPDVTVRRAVGFLTARPFG